MQAKTMWANFLAQNPHITQAMDAWSFGAEADQLAQLVLAGTKTATASAYDLYALENEPLPQAGSYDVILDSQDQAVCIIQITKVEVLPFKQVSADHAFKEGEGDKSLAYWRQVHEELFGLWLQEAQLSFSEETAVVLEEFKVVYP